MTNGTRTVGADAGPAVPHVQERTAALSELGWAGRDAVWLVLVCLHIGVFLRSQYLAFTGQTNPALRASGRAVEVVVAGRDPVRLAALAAMVAVRIWWPFPPFGAGSGKTSACMRPFARQLLSWQADDRQRRIAGLVLEVKGDFCHK